jgi:glycine cleavage system H protein
MVDPTRQRGEAVEFPEDLQYTAEHEWVRSSDTGTRIGITSYAQDQLGDIVFVDLPEIGATLAKGEVMVEVESTKSVGEVYAPFSGTVTAINESVLDRPELVNQDPYGDGWLVEMTSDDGESIELIDAAAYRSLVS